MAPQIITVAISLISLGIAMANHGKPNKGNYSFWYFLFSQAITHGLLYWGGYYDVFFDV